MGRLSLILISISFVCFICCQSAEISTYTQFLEFAKANGREFHSAKERHAAYEAYRDTLDLVNRHQSRKHQRGSNPPAFDVELNQFALMTEAERDQMNGAKGHVVTSKDKQIHPTSRAAAIPPPSVDWVANGAVNPPGNQGQCGSCWAFAATGAMEGAVKIKYGSLLDLSEENLVACDKNNGGCVRGGDPATVYSNYTIANKLMKEPEYPYSNLTFKFDGKTNPPQACAYNGAKTTQKYTTKGPIYVTNPYFKNACDESVMLTHAAVAPVAASIYVVNSFFAYKSGIYDEKACPNNSANHFVLIVGYGVDAVTKVPYWRIKNSWGSWWGENGYARIKRGSKVCSFGFYSNRPELN